ncbi:hypothetical protein BDK51DRAFT_37053, partial [Blyttiomyces helicus]
WGAKDREGAAGSEFDNEDRAGYEAEEDLQKALELSEREALERRRRTEAAPVSAPTADLVDFFSSTAEEEAAARQAQQQQQFFQSQAPQYDPFGGLIASPDPFAQQMALQQQQQQLAFQQQQQALQQQQFQQQQFQQQQALQQSANNPFGLPPPPAQPVQQANPFGGLDGDLKATGQSSLPTSSSGTFNPFGGQQQQQQPQPTGDPFSALASSRGPVSAHNTGGSFGAFGGSGSQPVSVHNTGPSPLSLHNTGPSPLSLHHTGPSPLALHRTGPSPLAVHNTGPSPLAFHNTGGFGSSGGFGGQSSLPSHRTGGAFPSGTGGNSTPFGTSTPASSSTQDLLSLSGSGTAFQQRPAQNGIDLLSGTANPFGTPTAPATGSGSSSARFQWDSPRPAQPTLAQLGTQQPVQPFGGQPFGQQQQQQPQQPFGQQQQQPFGQPQQPFGQPQQPFGQPQPPFGQAQPTQFGGVGNGGNSFF